MSRTFKTVNYDQALELTVRLGDCLPPDHLARFVVDSVAQLDLSALYARYGPRGGKRVRCRSDWSDRCFVFSDRLLGYEKVAVVASF
jgi:hypothetical protein